MKVTLIGRMTELGKRATDNLYEMQILCGKVGATCYAADSYFSEKVQDVQKAEDRIVSTCQNGHHSVIGHGELLLHIEGLSKLGVMFLNSVQTSNTSEKSARYTQMEPKTSREKELYEKWYHRISSYIEQQYGDMPAMISNNRAAIKKLAQENARYMTSIMTPTSLVYKNNYRELSYLCNDLDAVFQQIESEFSSSLVLRELADEFDDLRHEISKILKDSEIELDVHRREPVYDFFDFLINPEHPTFSENYYGDMYTDNHISSLASLAQQHRHRTLNYSFWLNFRDPSSIGFFVPPIIPQEDTVEWINDLHSIEDLIPQATLVNICEQGSIANFLRKCDERLCGYAQLETMQATYSTFQELWHLDDENVHQSSRNIDRMKKWFDYNTLGPVARGERWGCQNPCMWGCDKALVRKI